LRIPSEYRSYYAINSQFMSQYGTDEIEVTME
jgi:hypothetical protein